MIKDVFRFLRRLLILILKKRFASAGQDLFFDPFSSRIRGYRLIHIGDRVFIGYGAQFSISKELTISDDVLFGPQVMILSGSHQVDNVGATINSFHDGVNGRCIIGRDVWIGARTIIIGDVCIGEGAVVGAGSIVTRNVPPYTIAAGVPCRPIRKRFSDEELNHHLEALGRPDEAEEIISARNSGLAL